MLPRALRQGGVAAAATRAHSPAHGRPRGRQEGRRRAGGGSGREPNRSAPPPGPARRRLHHCCARERPTRRLAARSEPDLRAGVGECGPRAQAFRPRARSAGPSLPSEAGSAGHRSPSGWVGGEPGCSARVPGAGTGRAPSSAAVRP